VADVAALLLNWQQPQLTEQCLSDLADAGLGDADPDSDSELLSSPVQLEGALGQKSPAHEWESRRTAMV
jgi:hypothetical protein